MNPIDTQTALQTVQAEKASKVSIANDNLKIVSALQVAEDQISGVLILQDSSLKSQYQQIIENLTNDKNLLGKQIDHLTEENLSFSTKINDLTQKVISLGGTP